MGRGGEATRTCVRCMGEVGVDSEREQVGQVSWNAVDLKTCMTGVWVALAACSNSRLLLADGHSMVFWFVTAK